MFLLLLPPLVLLLLLHLLFLLFLLHLFPNYFPTWKTPV